MNIIFLQRLVNIQVDHIGDMTFSTARLVFYQLIQKYPCQEESLYDVLVGTRWNKKKRMSQPIQLLN